MQGVYREEHWNRICSQNCQHEVVHLKIWKLHCIEDYCSTSSRNHRCQFFYLHLMKFPCGGWCKGVGGWDTKHFTIILFIHSPGTTPVVRCPFWGCAKVTQTSFASMRSTRMSSMSTLWWSWWEGESFWTDSRWGTASLRLRLAPSFSSLCQLSPSCTRRRWSIEISSQRYDRGIISLLLP